MALMMYPGLTQGAIAAILAHGTDEQKATWLPKMVEGAWTGTMNLTEPHCGTDLGLLRTKAVPQGDGTYKISGQKIFISAGEHDLADNIVHLVLARIEGAPEGVKGISLFIVPKFMLDADGNPGERNAVSCGSIEEKMGIHGNATCVMNYDEADGYAARRGERRPQGHVHDDERGAPRRRPAGPVAVARSPTRTPSPTPRTACRAARCRAPKAPDKPADPIIVHPDIRRSADDHEGLQRGRPRAGCCGRRSSPTSPTAPATTRSARRPTTTSA